MVIPLVSDDDLLSRLVFRVRVFLDYYHHILRLLICGSLAYDDDAALHAVVQNVLLNFL